MSIWIPPELEVLVVDDEKPARDDLADMITEIFPWLRVHSAGDVEEALEVARKTPLRGLFLDIRMPGGSGFDLLRMLPPGPPRVVFTTAYSEYAIDAFRVRAVDYLLKPIKEADLRESLLRLGLGPEAADGDPAFAHPLRRGTDTISVRFPKGMRLVRMEDVLCLMAHGNSCAVHLAEGVGFLNQTLRKMEELLNPGVFFRCGRAVIVNLSGINQFEFTGDGRYLVKIPGLSPILISRRRSAVLRQKLMDLKKVSSKMRPSDSQAGYRASPRWEA